MLVVVCVSMSLIYVFFVFFFFKQKTAYEMRISDWSSDVCSSDLMVVAAAIGDQVADRPDLQIVKLREGDQIVHPRHGAVVLHDLADHAGRVEIGRASGRERVCQYV